MRSIEKHGAPLRAAALALALALATLAPCRADAPQADPVADPWAEDMRRFAAEDAERPVAPGGVVFVGSSSIRLWDLARSFPEMDPTPLNRGFGGSHLADSNRRLQRLVLRHKPRLVVLYAGDNDIAAGVAPERVAEDFAGFARRVRAGLPRTRVVYLAIKPSVQRWALRDPIRRANALIRAQCDADPLLTYLDTWPLTLGDNGAPDPALLQEDGLHLNEAGYRAWAGALRPLLDPAWREAGAAGG